MEALPNRDRPEGVALGRHLTVEYYDCSSEILADAALMEKVFVAAAKASGATVLGSSFHDFMPQGVSGFVIIAESHFSVHAWPEYEYAAVDIFTCGGSIDFMKAVDELRAGMKSDSVVVSGAMSRGIPGNDGMVRTVPVEFNGNTGSYSVSWRERFDAVGAWAISSSVDVYNCAFTSGSLILDDLRRFATAIGLPEPTEVNLKPVTDPSGSAGVAFALIFGNGSVISGGGSSPRKSLHVDVFTTFYVEPRRTAELALTIFKGSNYRMQSAVRK